MRRICYSVATSLDGYIAGPNGEFDWILMDPDIDFEAILARFDTVFVGGRTYREMLGRGEAGQVMGMTTCLFSRTMQQVDHPKVTVIGPEGIADSVEHVRAESGKDIWLFGGGDLFRSLLDLGLVDAVEVAVIPVLLGGGIPLLPQRDTSTALTLRNQRVYEKTGTVWLEYEVTR